jgi:hypothetical protein
VLAGTNVPRVNNVNFALNVGVSVPSSVRVVEVPPTLIEIYPEWRGHQYFVVNDDIVIVDRSRKIVATLPMSSAGGAAQIERRGGGAQTGSAGEVVNLGPDEIRQVQIVLKERGFYRGEPDGVLGTATTQALIAFQRREGLQANGRIDTRTVTALGVSNPSGQQGNQNQPATSGQGGNAPQQSPEKQQPPANENVGRAGQPSGGQNNSNAMPQSSNEKQQQPANQNAGAGQQNNQSGNQPATTGQGADRSQQPAAGQGSGSDKSGQPVDQKPQQGNPNSSNK